MTSPLTGIRVIDLSRVLAGPWATQTLADMGAEVIKIERPVKGDDTRNFAPFLPGTEKGAAESIYFLSTNRGKRSITIDLKTDEGQDLVRELTDQSDVLVENYRVGTLAKLGLDYSTLSARNRRLIYCSITGFGQTGPQRFRAGYDLVVEAMGGLMSITGEQDREPMKSGVAMADILTALYATTAITGALFEREHSGRGEYIDLALLDVQVATLANQAANYLISGNVPQRRGNAHDSIVPYQVFATSDGNIVVAVANDLQFTRLSEILGMPELAKNPEFETNGVRVANRGKLIPMLADRFLEQTSREWLQALDEAQIPAGPINSLDSVFREPQIAARELITEFPARNGRPIRVVGSPMRFSRTSVAAVAPPPRLGEHTDEVLSKLLHKSENAIRALREKRVI